MKIKSKNTILAATLLAITLIGVYGVYALSRTRSSQQSAKASALIYKSLTCSCCTGHASYLKNNNFNVEVQAVENMDPIKDRYQIPYELQSCHTTVVDGYFVEGHVPIEAIEKLLTTKPDIDGITLPGMPAGSPGMPGKKAEKFVIYSLKDGKSDIFMEL